MMIIEIYHWEIGRKISWTGKREYSVQDYIYHSKYIDIQIQ